MADIESLTLDDLTFKPYTYREWSRDGALHIKSRVLISGAEYQQLWQLVRAGRPFSVIRHGIDEEPREMRFGETYWSKHDEGIKHELWLVETCLDEDKKPDTADVQALGARRRQKIERALAQHMEILDGLIQQLVDSKVLASGQAEKIRERAIDRRIDVARDFYRVDDIDEF